MKKLFCIDLRRRLLDLLFPPKCPFCGKLLEEELLCPDCRRDLPWISGKAAETEAELTAICISVLRYQDKVRSAVHAYKFGGRSARSGPFGALIAQAVLDWGMTADLISWPSLSKKRLRKRGYDQAELLALEVGSRLGLPVLRTVDKQDRPAQSGLEGEAARRANLLGAYRALSPECFAGKRVLLIDDVVTTGSTLSECARILRTAGAGEVLCATLAKAGD